jgi:soluble epoxide hydrolase / lipid-phosphate phosphatase
VNEILSKSVLTGDHRSFYLECGPIDGPAVVLIHGWPELSLSWRHVMPRLAGLGFRAIAPDMRGYGRSSVYPDHADYRQERVVADMIGLADALGILRAVWVGHDWGTATAWNIAAHHGDRCHAVANLCVPYRTIELGLEHLVTLVDRDVYPAGKYPDGQWAYMRFYHERFDRARAVFDASPYRAVKALFRRGNPEQLGRPSGHVSVFANNGWFGGGDTPPDLHRDDAVLSEEELCIYAESLSRNGFFGPDSYYMNDDANRDYCLRAPDGGRLAMPVLFVAGRYDITCESVSSRLADPMRALCDDLTFEVVDSGHWMAQEKPTELSGVLVRWLATKVPQAWPA